MTAAAGSQLSKTRVQPLCSLASEYPQVPEELRALDASGRLNVAPLHEHFLLLRDIEAEDPGPHPFLQQRTRPLPGPGRRSPLLRKGRRHGKGHLHSGFSRLESARVLLRRGLTPTDLCTCGAITAPIALKLPPAPLLSSSGAPKPDLWEDLTAKAYDLVIERLYKNIVRILLTTECDPRAVGSL